MGGHNKIDLVGQRFNRLIVLERVGVNKHQESLFRCRCDCGSETEATTHNLRRKSIQSCGCLRIDEGRKTGLTAKRHGMHNTPTYITWQHMRYRCANPDDDAYRWYGAKGVEVCDEWNSFEKFLEDMGERPEGMTLDRINPFGDYEPDNCRWADSETQHQNTRRNYVEVTCQQ